MGFKVGDRVKALDEGTVIHGWPKLIVGEIYIIERLDQHMIQIKAPDLFKNNMLYQRHPVSATRFGYGSFESISKINEQKLKKVLKL